MVLSGQRCQNSSEIFSVTVTEQVLSLAEQVLLYPWACLLQAPVEVGQAYLL